MRLKSLLSPTRVLSRASYELTHRGRLRRLRRTVARDLLLGHVDTMELLDIAARDRPRVLYDLGAEVGLWSLLAKALIPDAEVHAFEPVTAHHPRFAERLASVSGVTLHPVAVGDVSEVREMNVATASEASSLLPPGAAGVAEGIDVQRREKVRVVRLDEYVAERGLPMPDVVKADIQGYELEAFRGAARCLAHARHVISEVSFVPFYEGQALFQDVTSFLATQGFRVNAFAVRSTLGREIRQTDVLYSRPA